METIMTKHRNTNNDIGNRCPFTGTGCSGGTVYDDGTVGCGFKEEPSDPCDLMEDVRPDVHPRDWYNAMLLEFAS